MKNKYKYFFCAQLLQTHSFHSASLYHDTQISQEKTSNNQDKEKKGEKRKEDFDDNMHKSKRTNKSEDQASDSVYSCHTTMVSEKQKREEQNSNTNFDEKVNENIPCKDGASCRFQSKDRHGCKCLLSHPYKQIGSPTMKSEGANKKGKEEEYERKKTNARLKEEERKQKKYYAEKKEREAARHKIHLKRELEEMNQKEEEENRKKEPEKKRKSIEDKVRNDVEKRKKIAEQALEEKVFKNIEEEMYLKIEKEEAIKLENDMGRAKHLVQQAGGAGRGRRRGTNPWLEQEHIGTNLPSNQVFGFSVQAHIGTNVPINQVFRYGVSQLPRIPKNPPKNPNPCPVDIPTMLDAARKHMQNNLEMERRKKEEEEKQRFEDRIKKEKKANEVEDENKLQEKDKSRNKLVEDRGQKRPPPDLTTPEQGFVTYLKKEFGFLENPKKLDKEIYFHFSNVNEKPEDLKLGDEVEYFLHHKKDGRFSANGVKLLPEGTIPKLACKSKVFNGKVVRQLRSLKSDFCGLVIESNTELEFRFGVSGLIDKSKMPKKGEPASFQISQSENFAMNMKLTDQDKVLIRSKESYAQMYEKILDTQEKEQKFSVDRDKHQSHKEGPQEQGYVSTIKTDFGFIESEIEKTIFFHCSNFFGQFEELQAGHEVSYSTYQTKDGRVAANYVKLLVEGTIAKPAFKEGVLNGRVVRPLRSNKTDYHGIVSGHMEDGTQLGEFKFGVVSLLDKKEILKRGEPVSFRSSETGSIALCLKSTKEEEEIKRKLVKEQVKIKIEAMKEKKQLEEKVKKEFELKEREASKQEEEKMRRLVEEQMGKMIEDTKEKNKLEEKIRKQFEQREREACKQEEERKKLVEEQIRQCLEKTEEKKGLEEKIRKDFEHRERAAARNKRHMERELEEMKNKTEAKSFLTKEKGLKEKNSKGKETRSIEVVEKSLQTRNIEPKLDDEAILKQLVQGTKKTEVLETRNYGYVITLKHGFGFIESLNETEVENEIFFPFCNVDGPIESLEVGQEVEYEISRIKDGKVSAASVKVLPKNSIPQPALKENVYYGKVVRPLRRINQKQSEYCGLIEANQEELIESNKFKFGIVSLINKKDPLQEGDYVIFHVCQNGNLAMKVTRQKFVSHVVAVKSQYGFISNKLEKSKDLIFYLADLDDGQHIQVGDEVEFEATTNPRTKKGSASNVCFLKRPKKQVMEPLDSNMPSSNHQHAMASHEEEPMEEGMELEVSVEQVVEESQRVRLLVVEEDMEVLEMPGQDATDEVPCSLPLVVVDTNVLLHALALVKTLVEMGECVVFLTWMVSFMLSLLFALLITSTHFCRFSRS